MFEHQLLLGALTREEDESLVDIKFFLGSNRDITQVDLCREARKAVDQVFLGQVVAVDHLDRDVNKVIQCHCRN
jgi:hypothetical protein